MELMQDAPAPSRAGTAWSEDAAMAVERVLDLIETLTSKQRDLVVGLSLGSETTVALLKGHIPQGTRELLESHGVLNEDGTLTQVGQLVADRLAFDAGEGPDPTLLARASTAEGEQAGV